MTRTKTPRRLILFVALTASVFGLACSSTQSLTLISTKNVDLSAPHEVAERGAKKGEGRFWLLFIPFASEPNPLRATTKLLDEHEADYLTNVEVTKTGWSLLAVSWGSVSVKGDAYRRATVPAMAPTEPAAAPAEAAAE